VEPDSAGLKTTRNKIPSCKDIVLDLMEKAQSRMSEAVSESKHLSVSLKKFFFQCISHRKENLIRYLKTKWTGS
jgi:hypothetical protein